MSCIDKLVVDRPLNYISPGGQLNSNAELLNCWTEFEERLHFSKVHIFWEGHIYFWKLHQLLVQFTASQMIGGDFAKFCGLLRIYEL